MFATAGVRCLAAAGINAVVRATRDGKRHRVSHSVADAVVDVAVSPGGGTNSTVRGTSGCGLGQRR